MIKGLLAIYSSEETAVSENMNIFDRQLLNIRGEYEYSAGIASVMADPNASLQAYLTNFSGLLRSDKNAKILWVSVFVNGTNQKYYVNAGNYMQSQIALNVSPTSSTPSSALLNLTDMSASGTNFSSLINGTISMTLRYALEGYQNEDIIQFEVSNSSSVVLFLDAALVADSGKVREKSLFYSNIL